MKPDGAFLLSKLVELYAKQEGVKITYHIEMKETKNERNCWTFDSDGGRIRHRHSPCHNLRQVEEGDGRGR